MSDVYVEEIGPGPRPTVGQRSNHEDGVWECVDVTDNHAHWRPLEDAVVSEVVDVPVLWRGLRAWRATRSEVPIGVVVVGRNGVLRMVYVIANERGFGLSGKLLDAVEGEFPALYHDGNLSPDGERLVRRRGIPLEPGRKQPKELEDASEMERRGAEMLKAIS